MEHSDIEDEDQCETYTCAGLVRCKHSSTCLHPVEVCDGQIHCPLADDEQLCNVGLCPSNCFCVGHIIDCSYRYIYSSSFTFNNVHVLLLQATGLHQLDFDMNYFSNTLKVFDLSHNNIQDICSSESQPFKMLSYLQYINLQNNSIS